MSIDIAADRAIIAAATPGPWRVPAANMFIVVAPNARHNNSQEGLCPPYPWRRIAVIDTDSYPDDDATCYCSADARFISAARSRWPAALDEVERLRAENERLKKPRMFPLLRNYSKTAKPGPISIPWSVAEKAYSVYRARYGSGQSLEDLASRGGFGDSELDELYSGWRDEVSDLAARDATIAELRACLSQLREAAIGAYDDYATKWARDEYDAACEAADALLAKTAPKEGT